MPRLPQQQFPLGPKRFHKPKLSPWTKPSTCGTLSLHRPIAVTSTVTTIHAEDEATKQDTTRTVYFKKQNNNTRTMMLCSMMRTRSKDTSTPALPPVQLSQDDDTYNSDEAGCNTDHPSHKSLHWTGCYIDNCPTHTKTEYDPKPPRGY